MPRAQPCNDSALAFGWWVRIQLVLGAQLEITGIVLLDRLEGFSTAEEVDYSTAIYHWWRRTTPSLPFVVFPNPKGNSPVCSTDSGSLSFFMTNQWGVPTRLRLGLGDACIAKSR